MNMQALLKQAQKMQKDLAEKDKELKSKLYEKSMGCLLYTSRCV